MRMSMLAALLTLSVTALPGSAQQAPAGAAVVKNEPGKVELGQVINVSAAITAIDKATRTLTLKGPEGRVFDVVAGNEVRNFDQIKVGDEVVVEYAQALTLEVKKGGKPLERKETEGAVRAKPGEKPAGAVGRMVTINAEVIDVSPEKKTITVKGPKGNVVDLNVKNPEHFKVVKKGDQIQAEYVEAVAISVQPAAKAGGAKKP
jgi:hypothetical protein